MDPHDTRTVAEIVDSALAETNVFWEGRTLDDALADINAVVGSDPERLTHPDCLDELAVRWKVAHTLDEDERRRIAADNAGVALVTAALVSLEPAGSECSGMPWRKPYEAACLHFGSGVADESARAVCAALRDLDVDADGALARGVPGHVLASFYRDEGLEAIGRLAGGLDESALVDIIIRYGVAYEIDAFADAVGVDPDVVATLAPRGPSIDR